MEIFLILSALLVVFGVVCLRLKSKKPSKQCDERPPFQYFTFTPPSDNKIIQPTSSTKPRKKSKKKTDDDDYPMTTKRYTMHIVGEQYEGRQEVIKLLKRGDPLTLVREPDNSYDENAVNIMYKGRSIGYLSQKNAEWIADLLDDGEALVASVATIALDENGNGDTFLNVKIHVDGVPVRDYEEIY